MSLRHQIINTERLERQRALLGGEAVRPTTPKVAPPKANSIAARAIAASTSGELVRYDAACRAISEAIAVDELKGIHDAAKAMAAAARIANNKQAEADLMAIRFRAERRLGELMAAQREAGLMSKGAATDGVGKRGLEKNPRSAELPPTLAEAGIDKNLADRARKYAAIPQKEFEDRIDIYRESVAVEGERAVADLIAAGERHEAEASAQGGDTILEVEDDVSFDHLVAIWCRTKVEVRDEFVAYLRINGAITEIHRPADSAGSDGNRSIPRGDARGAGRGRVVAQDIPQSTRAVTNSNQQPNSSPEADRPAAPFKANPVQLRPRCKNPDHCGGYGRNHCRACLSDEVAS